MIEPTLQELSAQLDGLRRLVDAGFESQAKLDAERDRRYSERYASSQAEVLSALTATKEQTAAAFASSKEAISEAKRGQEAYNASHNDLLRSMEKQAASMLSVAVANEKFRVIEDRIDDLKERLSQAGGEEVGSKRVKDESRANLALVLSFVMLLLVLVRVWMGH